MGYYENLALKIVPPGNYPLIGRLRELIAYHIQNEVNKAVTRQREEQFPELQQVRKELEQQKECLNQEDKDMKRKHQEKQKELERSEEALRQREKLLLQKEQKLEALIQSFHSYMSWMEGDGEVDDNGKRFNALREAYRIYQGSRK